MISFLFRRIFSLVPLLIAISMLVFILMYISPGDFLSQMRNSKDISPEIVKQEEMRLGLDRPWYIQYGRWLNGVSPIKTSLLSSSGEGDDSSLVYFGAPDFGYSWSYKIPVGSLISQRLFATFILALASTLLTYMIAIPLGVLSAVKKDSVFDRMSAFLAYASLSIPYFFLALLAVLFAAVSGVFPTGGQTSVMYEFLSPLEKFVDYGWHLILPTIVLSVGGIASIMRVMRGNFLEYMRAEFVTTARAKGLSEGSIMFKHVLRNAINPIITSLGFSFAGLLSGALLVENVMNYPGLGQLIYSAIIKKDQYLVMAGVVMGCFMLVVGQVIADILLAYTDPRIRFENEKIPYKKLSIILVITLVTVVIGTYLHESYRNIFDILICIGKYISYGVLCILCIMLFVGFIWAGVYFFKNFFKRIMCSFRGAISLIILLIFYLLALFAPFVAPYSESLSCLNKTFHPPTRIVVKDFSLYAQMYKAVNLSVSEYAPIDGDLRKINFFVKDEGGYHLFGLDEKDKNDRIYLLGSDSTGRDVFSRLLYGARISLSIGFIGIAITMLIGFLVGGLSGYFGGTFDFVSMRIVEFLMAVPSLYLLLAMRSAFAEYFSSGQMYILIVIILSMLGWAGTARVIRGMSLSLAKREFVQAAKSMGESPVKIIWKHFFPNVLGFLIVSSTLAIPSYILGEAALSFLGLGIQEPSASWGLMLANVQGDTKIMMMGLWWMMLPGLAIFITVLSFNILGDVLRDIADPKE